MRRLNEVSYGEIAVAVAAGLAVAALTFGPLDAVSAGAHGYLTFALALIVLTDYRAFRIPDQLSLPLIPLGLATAWWMSPDILPDRALAAVIGGGGLYLLNRGYRAMRGHDGLGMGDVKLTAAAGAWAGTEGLAHVILIASLAGLATAMVFRRSLPKDLDTGRARLPFGCYEGLALLATVGWQLQEFAAIF